MAHILSKVFARTGAWMCVLAIIAITLPDVHALPMPEANPDLRIFANGQVLAAARTPDGGVVIGGDFTSISGSPRSRLARLRADGTLDPSWAPDVNGPVTALAISSGGEVYVGGDFSQVNAVGRQNLAKIRVTGALDPDWNPAPDANAQGMIYWVEIHALAVSASGDVFVGGQFEHIGGQARRAVAKLAGTGSGVADPAWNPSLTSQVGSRPLVRAIALDPGGWGYFGGEFMVSASNTSINIAKLSMSGGGAPAPGWTANVYSSPYSASPGVHAIAVSGTAVFIGGDFSSAGNQARAGLAKLDSVTGSSDAVWNPVTDSYTSIRTLTVGLGGDALFAGGTFSTAGGQNRHSLAKLATTGTGAADANWRPDPDKGMEHYLPQVAAVVAIDGNRLFVGGDFTTISGVLRRGAAIVATTGAGTAATAIDAERAGTVWALASQPGGGLVVGGEFVRVDNTPRSNLLRLKPDGKLDPSWNPAPDRSVRALTIDSQGNIYVGGLFRTIGGLSRARVAKLSAAGVVDTMWNPGVGMQYDPVAGEVNSLALNGQGSLFLGGAFERVGGQPRLSLAKVGAAGIGAVDPVWVADVKSAGAFPSANVNTMAADRAGNLFVGGSFDRIGSTYLQHIAKVSQFDAVVDAAWQPYPNQPVDALAVDNQGSLYLGGRFNRVSWEVRCGVAKVSTGNGALDPLWDPAGSSPSSCNGAVTALTVDSQYALYVGGYFWEMGGQIRNGLAKVATSGNGTVALDWDPALELRNAPYGNPWVHALSSPGGGRLYVGGDFSHAGGEERQSLASFADDHIFGNGFDGD